MDVPSYLELLERDAGTHPARAREAYETFRDNRDEERAKRVLDVAHRAFPTDPWVNGLLGLRDRGTEVLALADDETLEDALGDLPAYQRVVALREAVKKNAGAAWLAEPASKELDGWLAACRERQTWFQDPANARSHLHYRNLKSNTYFEKLDFAYSVARPYVLFLQSAGAAEAQAREAEARQWGLTFQCSYRRFHEFLRRDLGVDAPSLETVNDTRLPVFVFRNRRAFDQWHLDTNQRVPAPEMLAYYEPVRTRMVLLYFGLAQHVGGGAGGKRRETSTCFHEATHQLFDFYQRWFCSQAGKPLPEGYAQLDPRLAPLDTLFWFQEGLADYFGAVEPVPGTEGDWEVGRPDRDHLLAVVEARRARQAWKLSEFLLANQQEIYERANLKDWRAQGADQLKALLYAQGWLFVHYLMHGEGGRLKPGFPLYVRREITGGHVRADLDALVKDLPGLRSALERTPEVAARFRSEVELQRALRAYLQTQPEMAAYLQAGDFLECFGLPRDRRDPKVQAWLGDLERGYLAHADTLLKQAGPR